MRPRKTPAENSGGVVSWGVLGRCFNEAAENTRGKPPRRETRLRVRAGFNEAAENTRGKPTTTMQDTSTPARLQ